MPAKEAKAGEKTQKPAEGKAAAKPAAKAAKATPKAASKPASKAAPKVAKAAKAAPKTAAKPASKVVGKVAGKVAPKAASKVAAKVASKTSTKKRPAGAPKKALRKKSIKLKKSASPDHWKVLLAAKRAARPKKITIDCSKPVASGILDLASLEKYYHDNLMVSKKSKPGIFGAKTTITKQENNIVFTLQRAIKKKYLKGLTKTYLHSHRLRDWLRVVAVSRDTFQLKFYNIQEAGDESDESEGDD